MNRAVAVNSPEELSESQREALLTLLADDDPTVYRSIRQKILSLGPRAGEWLRPHALSRDPALRRRAQEIVLRFDRQAADNVFLGFCLKHGEDLDLETGAWLLAQTQYPEINTAGYRALLDSFAADLRERTQAATDDEELLKTVNKYLFQDLNFCGNDQDYYDPEGSYLNRVLDRRTGNPINLCVMYMLLCRRLQLPVAGIGMPGHFLCRYQSSSLAVYVDVFHGGRLLNKADCVRYLLQGSYSVRDEYLAPLTPRRILLRVCTNLHQIYLHQERPEDATRVQRYLVALAR